MSKAILKFLFVSVLVLPVAFADTDISADIDNDDTLSSFNRQGNSLEQPKPNAEENFFATRAPIEATLRRYFGVSLGSSFVTLKPTITATSSANTSGQQPPDSQSLDPSTPKLSWGANLYGGCGANIDHFYIGAELSGGYNTLKYDQSTNNFKYNNNTTITFKQPLNLGLDFMPGYITPQKDFLFYGRIGLAAGLFNIRINNSINSSINKFLLGWRAGFGMEYFISETFSTRFDYVFTNYNNMNNTYTSKSGDKAEPTIYSYKINSPHTQQINLGLTINF
ncbi:MAG: outer membrane beta-barrel protein [bacterium]